MSSSRTTWLLEIVGPAGSGKSTVAMQMAGQPGVRTVSSVAPAEPWLRQALAAGRAAPRMLQVIGRGAIGRRGTTRRQLAWVGRLVALGSLTRRADDDILVLDQGPLYTLSRLLAARPDITDDRWLKREMVGWADRLDAVLVLDAPDQELVQRIRTRGKAHALKHSSVSDALAAVAQQRAELDIVVVAAESLGLDVLRIGTDEANAEQIVTELTQLARGDLVSAPGSKREPS